MPKTKETNNSATHEGLSGPAARHTAALIAVGNGKNDAGKLRILEAAYKEAYRDRKGEGFEDFLKARANSEGINKILKDLQKIKYSHRDHDIFKQERSVVKALAQEIQKPKTNSSFSLAGLFTSPSKAKSESTTVIEMAPIPKCGLN